MQLINTNFDGLWLIKLQYFTDIRGSFYESWRESDYKKIGVKENFVQDNISVSKQNVLRGLHYQKHQGQLVTVVHGKIFDVAVDMRPESTTYKKYFSIELDDTEPVQLYMPPGFAHGFCVLSNVAIVSYKCTQYYDPLQEGGIIWNDPVIDIKWPVQVPLISAKDLNFLGI
jgi:dTDP-4-dehydrorhamnose 3,5-epimerase